MKNKLLTGGAIALILCLGGLMLMANPNAKPPTPKPAPDAKPGAQSGKVQNGGKK